MNQRTFDPLIRSKHELFCDYDDSNVRWHLNLSQVSVGISRKVGLIFERSKQKLFNQDSNSFSLQLRYFKGQNRN